MSNFKIALKRNYRFVTPVGEYDTEMLFKLSLPNLDKTIISLDEQIEKTSKKSYLETQDFKLEELKLKREIVLEILNDKINEKNEIEEKRKKNSEKATLLRLLEEKRTESLNNLTEEEILKKLESL